MYVSTIIFSIIIVILYIVLIYLYKQINSIKTNLNKDDMSVISNLKVKNLEVIDSCNINDNVEINNLKIRNLKTNNINSIDVNDDININNNLSFNADNINVNPKTILNTDYIVSDKDYIPREYLQLSNIDDETVNMKLNINDMLTKIYLKQVNNKQTESFRNISRFY